MNVPADLRYSTDHEWVRHGDDSTVTLGITDYAQDALGDVVYVELPEVGATFSVGDTVGEVESTKSVSELYAAVSGTVASINEALVDNPGLLNDDPYGDGWICTITLADGTTTEGLLDAAAYQQLIEG